MRKQSIKVSATNYWEGGRENGFRARARKRLLEQVAQEGARAVA
eukprot:COSAG02_NODE_41199_length_397_cov_0.694631_1_plen_43_part_10